MSVMNKLALGSAVVVAGMVWGCESEQNVNHVARANRAVESPTERNSASGEMVQLAEADGVPLVVVGIPNKAGERPAVRTIVDNIGTPALEKPPVTGPTPAITGVGVGGTTLPATLPATQPATRPGLRVDSVLGPGE